MTGVLATSGTVAVYVLFLLLEQHSFNRKITTLFPNAEREARVRRVLGRIGSEIQSYIWLKTLMGLMVTGASYLVMKLVGVDLAEFWALLIFALSYIPYLGAWVGVIFPTTLALVQFDTLNAFLVTAGALAVIQFTCGSIIEPRIMGKGLNISPLIMLLSLAVWGALWGIAGNVPGRAAHGGRDDCLLAVRGHAADRRLHVGGRTGSDVMAKAVQQAAAPPPTGRLLAGVGVFVLGWIVTLAVVPLITATSLPTSAQATISAVAVFVLPKFGVLAAIAIMGKPGFAYLKGLIFGYLKPPAEVSPARYRMGIIMFAAAILLGFLEPYLAYYLTGDRARGIYTSLSIDLLLLSSILVLGGDFWDKIRALFVRDAKAVFP